MCARHAVDRRMMNPRQNRIAALCKAGNIVETFQHIHVPERPGHIQRLAVMTGYMDAKLPPVPGLRQAAVGNMRFQIKMLVFHPVRVVNVHRQTV